MGLLLALLCCWQPAAATQCRSQSLDGEWQLTVQPQANTPAQLTKSEWQSAQVPANWYLQRPWLSGKVWYRRIFSASPECLTVLRFEGADYHSSVWLNGQALGQHRGYFAPFELGAGHAIANGENELLVLVDSPLETEQSWSLRKTTIKGVLSHHDTRPGGAWSVRGQERNTGGIWNSVWLDQRDSARLGPLSLTAEPDAHLRDWTVTARASVQLAEGVRPSHAELVLRPINGATGATYRETINNPELADGKLAVSSTIRQPDLWYPAGFGEQALYELELSLYSDENLLDRASLPTGFRKVQFRAGDETFLINNRAFFVRGTNYISEQMLSTMDDDRYQRDLTLMRDANINAVRVHAHIERQEFYRLADRMGMLVWQDFPLQWGYSDSPDFRDEAVDQLTQMVDTLGHHPSIVNWTLQNEPPFDAFWMKWKYPDYNPEQNRNLVDELRRRLDQLDQSRWNLNYSATDTHPWLGWYSGTWRDYAKPSRSRWVTEFGAQALPHLESLKKIFFSEDLWPDNDHKMEIWKYRNFQPRETFEIAGVSMGDDIESLIYNTQRYQSRVTAFAARALRRQKYAGVNGIFQFMFNENWPSVNWGVVDYWREPKPGYHALSLAYQPVMPMIDWRDDTYTAESFSGFAIWLLNDHWTPYRRASLTLSLTRDGQMVDDFRETVDLAADSASLLYHYQPVITETGNYQLMLYLHDTDGELLGSDEHLFSLTGGVLHAEVEQ